MDTGQAGDRQDARRSARTRGGWSLEVYGAADADRPTTLQGWGSPIGQADDVGTDQTSELTATSPCRYYLIWITKLASDESGYNVAIGEVELSS